MLPPGELKNKEFARVVRGYSIPEVDEYIAFLLEKYKELYAECDRLEKEAMESRDALAAQKQQVQAVKSTLIAAQQASEDMIANALKEEERIKERTVDACEQIIDGYRDRFSAEYKRAADLKAAVQQLKNTLFSQYSEHIRQIEELTADLPQTEQPDGETPQAHAAHVQDMVREEVQQAYVNKTYDAIPRTLTQKAQAEAAVFSDPAQRKITAPEEDLAPTTEIPSVKPVINASVGGAKITSVRDSVRSLDAQFDALAQSSDSAEQGADSQEDEFLKFLAEHPLQEEEEEEDPFQAIWGADTDK